MCYISSLYNTARMVRNQEKKAIEKFDLFVRTPRGERRHYISKGCDTRDACTRRKCARLNSFGK